METGSLGTRLGIRIDRQKWETHEYGNGTNPFEGAKGLRTRPKAISEIAKNTTKHGAQGMKQFNTMPVLLHSRRSTLEGSSTYSPLPQMKTARNVAFGCQ